MRTGRRDHEGKWFGAPSRAVIIVAGALGLGFASPSLCLAQTEPEPSLSDYLPPSEPEVSREEWRQRIEDARRRATDVSRERREHPELYKPIPEDPDLVATERLFRDESLQRGDIVATKKGMFVYQGRSDQPRRDQDFVPVNPKSVR
ncbi:hypothetical protein IVB14_24630 [Bradyrhizobium sp. 180]|nr:hypothetical protein [Bradyrhizobium sp. CW12]MCK1493516.1 hypothetical protein [Bradyrhizobium sp. 180]MCK1526276.1 hypothetical protein [Bradyrhizobium sp. 182]MCK1595940.1 hypothetical protein [Bradyrhizobium sp. 164]MCK1647148.1 hypothetical protein [Bradyrhizobium sp. 154]MCK1668012.1 hypothetical protein [Bradyrhizobium sp. 153]